MKRQHVEPPRADTATAEWLVGGGETGDLIRRTDWSTTSFGPREAWSASLRTAVSMVLGSQFPMALLWGRDLLLLYNDAYRELAGKKHPAALGRSTREAWAEVWHINEPIFAAVMDRGETTFIEDKLFPVDRHGRLEDAFFTLCYSPVRVHDGRIEGALVTLLETTRRVQEQREQEQRLRVMFENVALGVTEVGVDGSIETANRRLGALLGYEPEKLVGMSIHELTAPEDRDRSRELYGKVLRGELDSFVYEKRYVKKEGALVWVRATVSSIRDARGVVRRAVGTVEDISERKRVEEDLNRERALLQGVFDNIPVLLVLWDERLKRFTLNRRAEEVLGWTTADANDGDLMAKVYPDPDYRAVVTAFMRSLQPEFREWFGTTKRGDRVPVEWANVRLRDDTSIGIGVDLRERKQAEEAKHEAYERYERQVRLFDAVVSTTPDFVYLFDRDGRFVYANRRLLEVWGVRLEDAVGKTCRELGYEQWHHDLHMREIAQVKATKQPIKGEVPFKAPLTGIFGVYEYIFAPVIGPDGEVELIAGTTRDVTERKRTEDTLRARDEEASRRTAELQAAHAEAQTAAERVQLALAAGAIVGTWDWELGSDRFTVDERFAEYFGIDRALGRTGLSLEQVIATVHPDDLPGLHAAIDAAIARGGAYSHEYRVRGLDGVYRWVQANGRVDRAPDGTPTRFPGVLLDIGKRRELEAERDRATQLLRAFIDAVPGVVYAKDRDGRMLVANRGVSELVGKPPEAYLGKTDLKFLDRKDQAAAVMATDRRIMEGGQGESLEEEISFPDGRRAIWLSTKAPFRDARGRVIGLIGSSVDITARKEAEAALRRSEERARASEATLDAFFQASPGILNIEDENFRYVKTDSVTPTYFNLTRETIVGRSLAELVPEFVDAFGPMMKEVLETGVPKLDQEVHSPVPGRPGRVTTWRASYFPVPLPDGRRGLGVMGVEITDIKKAQEEQKRLLQALRDADEQKNAFLAVLSHELRNPLTPIRNSLYILDRATPGGEQAKRAMTVVDRQVTHLARLIDDLLDVTRISRGKIRLQRESLELNEIIRGTADDLRALFRANGIAFEVSIARRPLRVFADRTRIAQMASNLLQNAAKFTPAGGRVAFSLDADASGNAVVQVRDTGVGIEREVIERLFQPFVQAEQTLDRTKGGLGLGLALVKGLVDLHGGSVSARSEGAGTGAEFTVKLPLQASQVLAKPQPLAHDASATKKALRVLLIEDNEDAADSLKEALELNGHEVETAGTGLEGIEKARVFHPDVVLCDIGLPGIDGFEVARRMRGDPILREACLIALSGYAAPEDFERSRAAGFAQHLAKPPDLGVLENTLFEACDGTN